MTHHRASIEAASAKCQIDPDLVEALVIVESGGDEFAWNPEPNYRYFWDVKRNAPFRPTLREEARSKFPPKDFPTIAGDPDQEWWGQQASWGLMQVMGAVARELGYRGRYLPSLCHIDTNLALGCLKLRQLLTWADGDEEQALAAYNGGRAGNLRRPFRNELYAAKVLVKKSAVVRARAEHHT